MSDCGNRPARGEALTAVAQVQKSLPAVLGAKPTFLAEQPELQENNSHAKDSFAGLLSGGSQCLTRTDFSDIFGGSKQTKRESRLSLSLRDSSR